jgi:large conductance mechanosensitive channel
VLKEFKKFALRGNVIDLAVGVVIGAAFGAIVTSLVNDIIMPPIGLALGGVNFNNLMWILKEGTPPAPYATPADAAAAGAVTMNYGHFFNTIITFVIIAFVVFLLIRGMNKLVEMGKKPEPVGEPTTKVCPFCSTEIPIKAQRCPHCTSTL